MAEQLGDDDEVGAAAHERGRGGVPEDVDGRVVVETGGRGEPNWQPISMLATIASSIDGGLADARDRYAMLLKARAKPFVLDDATIADTKRVNGEGLEWCDVYDRQLQRWRSERLTGAQRGEVARLQGVRGSCGSS
ncbi:MAG: hypothetical protein WBP81_09555 [Solirubrobacteraceae bacterium]